MLKDMIFGVIGGLGLFLFGMGMMSDALKKAAGRRLKNILESLTKHRIIAVLVGTFATAMIQSSSAITVMVVGFVNAGLLSLRQALCVVMGANIGTTITAGLVSTLGIGAFKITSYALPAIGIGFLLRLARRTQRLKSIGNIILGFGLLFTGLAFMKDGSSPLGQSEKAQEILIWLGENPILAVLAGAIITMLLQSSSASIAIIQLLAFQGAFGNNWEQVLRITIPFILGDNIGTTITAQLAALQTSRNSKRVAMGHTIFNIIGAIYMLPLVWKVWFADLVQWITPFSLSKGTVMLHIFIAHMIFNIFNTILFLPMIGWLEYIVMKILPVRKEELLRKPVVLERHLLSTPVLALEQARREMVRMAQRAKEALNFAINGLINNNRRNLDMARTIEDLIDDFQYHITSYLAELSTKELSSEESIGIPVLLHTVNDLERAGDHAVNIVEIAERKIEQKLAFSNSALTEAQQLKEQVNQMFDKIIPALEKNDIDIAKSALANEESLNKMQMDFRRSHVQRMTENMCSPEAGLIFIDLVDNVEKIGDHLTNIAQGVIGGLRWDGAEAKSI